MKIGRTIKNIVKPHVDAPTWVDLNFLSKSITSLVELGNGLIIPQKATYQETFDEAVTRLNLTEEDIQKRLKQFERLQVFFLLLILFALSYCIYLLIEGTFTGALLCLSVVVITFSQVFRYNFWAFQLKQRKLGCTFKEWINHLTKRA